MKLSLYQGVIKQFSGIKKQIQSPTVIAQGVKGSVSLITGNFRFYTKQEAQSIKTALAGTSKVLVLLYDRDSISVPANERAMWIREEFKHNPRLEVRVAYGPPAEKPGNENLYTDYIKKQVPKGVIINSVRCNNTYSSLLAKEFQVPHISALNNEQLNETEQLIKADPKASRALITPIAIKRVVSPFDKIIDPLLFELQCEAEKPRVLVDIVTLNPNHPNRSSFFRRTPWNLYNLNRINSPVLIGNLKNKKQRSEFSDLTNTQVFDMPLYMPGQGWKIPTELKPYQSVLAKIVAAEQFSNPAIAECNAYVTVDCGVVPPNEYARRKDRHVDGFLTSSNAMKSKDNMLWGDNTYLISNNPDLQTECYLGPFNLNGINLDDGRAVLSAFDTQGQTMPYKQFNAYDIIKLNTNNVHAVHQNTTGLYLSRCFLKMTFSERLFNRGGNTINPHFNYRLVYVPRDSGRNTQNFIGLAPKGYEEVDLRDVDFKNSRFPKWLSATPLTICKKSDVRVTALPAIEGETLNTEVDGELITTNVARKGDMKVSRTNKDCYFLGSNFRFLYQPTNKENEYKPIPQILKAAQVRRNITFTASWGTRENISEGGYIVQNNQGESWGVHKSSFEATYTAHRGADLS